MKQKTTLRTFLALAGSTLLTITYASAGTYYWDSNDGTAGFGAAAGTWTNATLASATGSITYGTPVDGDTVTVNGVILTKAAAAGAAEFTTITELNALVTAIPGVDSTEDGLVVSITAATAGAGGNAITLAATGAMTVSGATLTGGASPTPSTATNGWSTDSTGSTIISVDPPYPAYVTTTTSDDLFFGTPTTALTGTVTIVGPVAANSIYWKTGFSLAGTTPTINFSATGSVETTGSTVGFPATTTLTGAGTSMTWKPINNLNITNITSNSAASTILETSPERATGDVARVLMNAEVNFGAPGASTIFNRGGVRMLSGFPYTTLSAWNLAHPITFTANKDVVFDNSSAGTFTFNVDTAVNLGTGKLFVDTGAGAATPVKLSSSSNIWDEVRISGGALEIDNLNQLGTTTLAAEAPVRFGSGFTTGAGGTLRIVGTGVTGFGTRTMLTTPGKTVGFDIADAGNTFTVNQLLDQTTGGLTKTGPGTLTINTTSSYTGTTTVSGGTLSYGTSLGIANGPVTVNGTTAVLAFAAYNPSVTTVTLTNGSVTGSGILTSSAAFALNPGTGAIVNAGIKLAGTLGLTKSAAGTATLSADNSGLSGLVTINGGILNINSTTALGTGAVTLTSGTIDATSGPITLSTNNTITLGGNFTFGGTNALNFGTGAITMAAGRTITLNGTASTLTFGGVLTNTQAGNPTLTANDGVALSGNTLVIGGLALSGPTDASNRTVTISGTGNVTINGPVTNGGNGTSTASLLTKTGTGTLTLNGTNTYAGNTTVNTGGTLALVGGSQESAITVNSGGLLGFTLGSPTTSTKNVTLAAGHKVRITGTPTPGVDYTLLTTSGLIINAPDIETPLATHTLEVEGAGTILVLKAIIVSTPFEDWALAKGLTGGLGFENGKTDDPDGDGKNNNFEFAFNGNPLSGSDNGMMAGLVQDASLPAGNELTLVVAVRDGATFANAGSPVVQTATKDGVIYTIEGTLDLVTIPGSDVSHPAVGASDTAPPATGLPDLTGTAWEYHTFKLDASEGLGNKGFLRAKAE